MRLKPIAVTILLVQVVASSALAQPVDRLEKLLAELRGMDPAVWTARVAALESRIKAQKAEAARLRAEAARLEAQAKASDAAAQRLVAEIGRQKELMKLIGPKSTPVTATAPAKPKPAAAKPKPAPAKPKPAAAKPKPAPAKPKPAAAKPKPAPMQTKPKVGKPSLPAPLNYEDDVLPILEQHCVGCHSPDDQSGGLDVASYEALMNGGSGGAVVKKNDSESSRLWRLVAHKETPTMPPDQGMIEKKQVDKIQQWIDQGAFADAAAARAGSEGAAPAMPEAPGPEAPTTAQKDGLGPPIPPRERLQPAAVGKRLPIPKTLAGSPTAPLVAAPGRGQVLLYESESLEFLGALPFPFDQVESLRFSADGERLLAGGGIAGKRGGAVMYDMRSGAELRRFGREFDSVLAVAMSPGRSRVALGGPSKKVRVFDVESGEKIFEITDHNDWIVSIDISPDGNFIASADRAGGLVITEADTGLNVHKLRGHTGAIWSVRFRPDAQRLATAGADGTIRMWEMDDGRSTRRSNAGQGEVLALAWNPRNNLASAGTSGRLKMWKPDGSALTSLPALPDWTYALAFPTDGQRLFAGQWSGRVHVIDVKTKKEVTPKADT